MPDPLEDRLRSLADTAARSAHGLDPAEVRRRGQRRHQRRVAGVAAFASVAVVAVGAIGLGVGRDVVGAGGNGDQGFADPTTTPAEDAAWTTEIPADFPITQGLAEGAQQEQHDGVGDFSFDLCGQTVFPLGDELDALGASAGGGEYGDSRVLVTYPDDTAADRVVADVVAAVGACPREDVGDGSTYIEWTASSTADGDVVVTEHYGVEDAGLTPGLNVWTFTERGNAVLALVLGGEGGATPQAVDDSIDDTVGLTEPLAGAMCVFTPEGCGEATEPTEPTADLSAADLPTADELPGFNEITSWRTVDTYPSDGQDVAMPCQEESMAGLGAEQVWLRSYEQVVAYPEGTTPDPDAPGAYTSVLAGQFPDEAAAQAARDTAIGWIEGCNDGDVTLFEPTTTDDGEGQAALGFLRAAGLGQDTRQISGLAVGVVGDRLVLVGQVSYGQDYNYPAGQTPIEGALQAALVRLAP